MTTGTIITVHFYCQCGMHYTASQVQMPEQRQGLFRCHDCKHTVHEWLGHYHYFDWKLATMMPVKRGEKI